MAEIGIAYAFTAPDGSRAVVGNCDAARLDPDFIGYLDAENGVTGLLDTADLNRQQQDLVQADGAIDGPAYLSRRGGTFQGLYLPNAASIGEVMAAERRLKRATRALRGDGILRWTPSDDGIERMLRFRRDGRVAQTGRRPKGFLLPLTSRDAYVLSASESNFDIDPADVAAELGIPNPITDPVTSPLNPVAATIITNMGDAPTWPRFRLTGPMTNPTLLKNATGERVVLNITLAAGETLDLYPEVGAIILNDLTNRYSALDFTASTWWQLEPGANDVRILPVAYSAGALVTVYWRHAWE